MPDKLTVKVARVVPVSPSFTATSLTEMDKGGTVNFQGSYPTIPLSAVKRSVPPAAVRSLGFEPSGPGRISATRTVPDAVPLLFQSSNPLDPSSALKKTVPLITVNSRGFEPLGPGWISATRTVPDDVPSLLQSSIPVTPSEAAKKSVPFALTSQSV